jgi:hypothetical protein
VPVKLTTATEKLGRAPRLLYYLQFDASLYKEAITVPKRFQAQGFTGSEHPVSVFYQEEAVSAQV